jgi:hypothetical protein
MFSSYAVLHHLLCHRDCVVSFDRLRVLAMTLCVSPGWYTGPMIAILLLFELLLLYLFTRKLTQNLYAALFLLTGSRPVAVGILSFIYFPGTVIHELAHMFTAEILGVKTGSLTLVPEGLANQEVRAGSVMIAKTDPIRRAIIGVAPVFVGLGALFTLSYFLPGLWQQTHIDFSNGIALSQASFYFFLLAIYSVFAISNTMFSSREDMKGFWPVALVLGFLAVSAYLIGLRLSLEGAAAEILQNMAETMVLTLGWIVGCTLILLFGSKMMIRTTERVTNRKLVGK